MHTAAVTTASNLGDVLTRFPRRYCRDPKFTWSARSTVATDSTFHQLAPYIGRLKTSIASALIEGFTSEGDLVVDPFSGCGVIALEAAAKKRDVYAGDWNPYAVLLTRAKLFPPRDLQEAQRRLRAAWRLSRKDFSKQDLRTVPSWVRRFFHPETLRDALAFRDACVVRNDHFLLACLLGILHHQRPGFLSYPSSHLVPYLRDRKFPRHKFREMYQRREVLTRLEAKLKRAFRRPMASYGKTRRVLRVDARRFPLVRNIKAVITSPPYMNELDYVRDNRLRLWFIEKALPSGLELSGRNRKVAFVELMRTVCVRLAPQIVEGGYFILVVGDVTRGATRFARTSRLVRNLFMRDSGLSGFSLQASYHDTVPDIRRSRRECRGTKGETILVFQKVRSCFRSAKEI
jgi:hypothetical protein